MACHEYLHKKFAPNRFDLQAVAPVSPLAQAMSAQGVLHENRVLEQLCEAVPRHRVIDNDLPTMSREEATVAALSDEAVDVIVHPVIGEVAEKLIAQGLDRDWSSDQVRTSRPDLLVRVSVEPFPFGKWAAVDIKSHGSYDKKNKSNQVILTPLAEFLTDNSISVTGRLKEADALQLAHYQRHLETAGIGNDDTWAGIIGRDIGIITWAKLHETKFGRGQSALTALSKYDLQFAEALNVAKLAQKRNFDPSVPAPAIPMLDSDPKKCPTCAFLPICIEEMRTYRNSGNVTLLAAVTPAKARDNLPLELSIGELAEFNEPLNAFGEVVKQRARVYQSGIPEIKRGVTGFAIPEFDIEIDIDLENSQGVLQEIGFDDAVEPDRLYLYGCITHDRSAQADWRESPTRTFENYSGTREGEHGVYLAMWTHLQAEIARAESAGKSIGIFHYSQHENTWWRKWANNFAEYSGTPTIDEMEIFISGYTHDLYLIAQQLVFPPNAKSPVCNYSIKTLAPLAGFSWDADDAGGANSLLKYQEATGGDCALAAQAQEWLRKYNVDDVKATMALRKWLRSLTL